MRYQGLAWASAIVAVLALAGCGESSKDVASATSSLASTGTSSSVETTSVPTSTPPIGAASSTSEVSTSVPVTETAVTEAAVTETPGATTGDEVAVPSDTAAVSAALASMTLRQKLAMTVFVGFNTGYGKTAGTTSPEDFQSVVDMGVGGVFIGRKETNLFGSDAVLAARDAELPLLIATDGEGGRVDIWPSLAEPMPPAADMGQMAPAAVRDIAAKHGGELHSLGINVTFAPMLDIAGGANPLGDRTWGADVDTVVTGTTAFSEGMCSAGVWPTFKHFPGHGRSDYDADIRPATTPDWTEMEHFDVEPFRQLVAKFPANSLIMSGHIDVPGLTTGGRPFSLDTEAMARLRSDVGFNGVIVTDELAEMGAITKRDLSIPTASEMAIAAGNDMLLFFGGPSEINDVLDRLESAVDEGRISVGRIDEAVSRILRLRMTKVCVPPQ